MTAPLNYAKLGLLLPAILNLAIATALGIGVLAVGLYRLLPDDHDYANVEDVPSDGLEKAVPVVIRPVPTVEVNELQQVDVPCNEPLQTAPTVIDEADQSEMIRKAMSELGKCNPPNVSFYSICQIVINSKELSPIVFTSSLFGGFVHLTLLE